MAATLDGRLGMKGGEVWGTLERRSRRQERRRRRTPPSALGALGDLQCACAMHPKPRRVGAPYERDAAFQVGQRVPVSWDDGSSRPCNADAVNAGLPGPAAEQLVR